MVQLSVSEAGPDPGDINGLDLAESDEGHGKTSKISFVRYFVKYRGLILGVLTVLLYLFCGAFGFYHLPGKPNNAPDAFYLSVVTFLTIGYGDLSPTSSGAKIFTIFFIFGALIVQATVGGYVLAQVVSVSADESFHRREATAVAYFKLAPQLKSLAKAGVVLLVLMLGGTFLLQFTEDKNFLDSLYWAVVTLTTVGYGDITPKSNKYIFATYFLFGVLAFGYVLGQSIGIVLQVMKMRKLRKFFERGLTKDMISRMDAHKDGQINRDEFIVFMLKELDLADTEEISRILGIFDTLDASGDGVLDLSDIRRLRVRESSCNENTALASRTDKLTLSDHDSASNVNV